MSVDTVVVIPCKNEAARLPRQLAALNEQTDRAFRVVVSDNGSTDTTALVASNWSRTFTGGISVVDSSSRSGVAHARNAAVQATGEPLILICDGDDEVHPGWVAAMRTALAAHACATGPLHLVYPDDPDRRHEVWNASTVPVSMGYRSYMPGCNIGMRREVFEATGGFDESLATGQEDVDFGWRLHDHGFSIAHSSEASIDYYQRSGLKSFVKQQWRYGAAHVNLYARHQDKGIETASRKASLRWFWEWFKQLPSRMQRRELREALGPFVFQISRNREAIRQGIEAPL